MKPLPIGGPTFWADVQREVVAGKGVAHLEDGVLQYVVLRTDAELRLVRRTEEELFEATVARAAKSLRVVINGPFYDMTFSGKQDALLGHDAVPATEATPVGAIIDGGAEVPGTKPSPRGFHFGFKRDATGPSHARYRFGPGDPAAPDVDVGIGGLGPVILGKLPYGNGNKYRSDVPGGAPATGPPGPAFLPFLTQRNSNHYSDYAAGGDMIGKLVVAVSRAEQKLLVLVVPDLKEPGLGLDVLRDKLVSVGVDDAVFLDGSDSVLLNIDGTFHIAQGDNKNECCTVGLGFRYPP